MTIPGNMTANGKNMPSPADGPLRRTFRGEPHQVRVMRDFVCRCLSDCRYPRAAVDDVLVCATELATNAVLHSRSGKPGGHFTVEIAIRTGQSVYVAVTDSGGGWVSPATATATATDAATDANADAATANPDADAGIGDFDAECGRGLRVVAALSADMGITGGVSSRTAWFLSPWATGPDPHPVG